MWKKIKFRLIWWFSHPLLWIIAAIVISHLPTILEPLWYWDSGFYQLIAQGMLDGKLLYVDIWDNKLPGIYLIFALFYKLFGHQQGFLHGFLTIWLCATAIVVFKLAKSLFSRKIGILSAWVFVFLTLPPVCTGGIPNAEIFMLLPNALAFYILFRNTNKITLAKSFFAGVLLGLGFYFKMVAVFELVAIGTILLFITIRRKSLKYVLLGIPIVAGFLIPIGATALYYYRLGYFADLVDAVFGHNAGYLIASKLTFRLIATVCSTVIVFALYATHKIKRSTMIVLIWFSFALLGALFSGRDWNHYFVQVFTSGAILTAVFIKTVVPMIRENQLAVKISGISLIVLISVLTGLFVNIMSVHQPYLYYENFALYILGKRSKADYDRNLNWEIPARDKTVEYLNNRLQPDETIFNYSDHAWIYALTNRYPPSKYVVMYHLRDVPGAYDTTYEALRADPPKYVVTREPLEYADMFGEWLDDNYVLEQRFGHIQIYSLESD